MTPGTAVLLIALAGNHSAEPKGVRWGQNFEEALEKARATHKPLMVDFWAEWCEWCHRLDQTTYLDPAVVRLSKDFVPVKIDAEGGPSQRAVAKRYDVSAVPTVLFISPAGHLLLRLESYQGPGEFPDTMDAARYAAQKVMGWESALERNAKDPEALGGLGVHLFDQGSVDEGAVFLDRARTADALRPSKERKLTRTHLAVARSAERNYADAEALLKESLSLEPPVEYDAQTLYILGRTYLKWGRTAEARQIFESILSAHSKSPMADKAREILVALAHHN